jgi:hypothetical protein
LNEMKSTGIQTDKIIDANQKLADAAVKQADAAVASASTIKDQLNIMQGQLDQMKTTAEATQQAVAVTTALERPYFFPASTQFVQPNGPNDPSPYVDYEFINAGRVPGVLTLFYVECKILQQVPAAPEFQQSRFQTADNAIGPGAVFGTKSSPLKLPRCGPLTDEVYADLRNNRSAAVFKAAIRYTGALDYSYVRIIGMRYNFNTNLFYEIGPAYNYETVEKNAAKAPPPLPKVVP